MYRTCPPNIRSNFHRILLFSLNLIFPFPQALAIPFHGASIHSNQSTLFDRLDDYSLLNILDLLDLVDLSNVALLGERYKQLILHHQIHKYGINHGEVFIRALQYDVYLNLLPVRRQYSVLINQQYNEQFPILRAFCPILGHVTIESRYGSSDYLLQAIADVINTHCSNVPQTMILRFVESLSSDVTFENVTKLQIANAKFYGGVDLSNLNKIYPRLEELRINGLILLNENLPHLKHFHFDGTHMGHVDFLALSIFNQQLSSIKFGIQWSEFDHLHQVQMLFPNLEKLDIALTKYDDQRLRTLPNVETIQFHNLKHFRLDLTTSFDRDDDEVDQPIDHSIQRQFVGIEFDQLESFTLAHGDNPICPDVFDFIVRNQKLTTLIFEQVSLTYGQMRRFIDELSKLKVLKFDGRFGNQFADIAHFVIIILWQ